MRRHTVIALNVVLLHAVGLWLLQSGLLRRTIEILVPAQIISELTAPALPPPPPPRPQAPPTPRAPMPRTAAPTPPAPAAPTVLAAPTPEPAVTAALVAPAPPVAMPAPAPTPATVELPTSSAAYLQNPKPAYPALSRRLGEQGTVVVRVLIGVDGSAQRGEIRSSSGFARLDQAALDTVLRWRYVPGKRGGIPEAMWFNVPINFVLE